jgi:hypothetical protein
MRLRGDIEAGSRQIAGRLSDSLKRSGRRLSR